MAPPANAEDDTMSKVEKVPLWTDDLIPRTTWPRWAEMVDSGQA